MKPAPGMAQRRIFYGAGDVASVELVKPPTENLEAYQNYLRGRYLWQRRGGDNIRNAIEAFDKAIELDPGFARAWSSLAAAHLTFPSYSDAPTEVHYPLAKMNARKALELDNTIAEAYAVLAEDAREERRWLGAEELYRQAIHHEPKNSTSYLWSSEHLFCAGPIEKALDMALKAYALDPLHQGTNQVLGEIYEAVGDYANHEKYSSASFELGHYGGLIALIQQRLNNGNFDEAREMMEQLVQRFGIPIDYPELRTAAFQEPGQTGPFFAYIEDQVEDLRRTTFLWDYIRLGHLDKAFEIVADQRGYVDNN